MTRIGFYLLKSNQPQQRQAIACRLAEKAYQQGLHVYIHTENANQSQELEQTLWAFRTESFVPHQLINHKTDHDCPVLIGHDANPPRLMDVLINFSATQPMFFSQFERVIEIIDDDETVKQAGRQRYQFYKQRGYELETHHL